MDPPCMGYRRSRRRGDLRVLFARSKFLCFDASITVARNFDCECRVPQSIEDGIRDDRVRDHLAPVFKRQL
jgi:hypothetical protein